MKMKKLLIVVSMLAVMFSLSGCGEKAKAPFEYSDSDLVLDAITQFDTYADVSEDYAQYYIESGSDFEKTAVKGIRQAVNTDKVGKFQDYSIILNNQLETGLFSPESVDYKIVEDKDAVLVTVTNRAENRDVEITVKYEENPEYFIEYDKALQTYSYESIVQIISTYDMTIDDLLSQYNCSSVDELTKILATEELNYKEIKAFKPVEMVVSAVYSKSELIKAAAVNTAIGMGTVFVVLIFISFIISLFKFLPALFAPKTKMPEAKKVEAAPVAKAEAPANSSENLMNDAELVAVITAAIYAASASSSNGAISKDTLVVRSIRRVRK